MSCKTLLLEKCEIKGSTFSSTTYNFTDRDITNDTFYGKVYLQMGGKFIADISAVKSGSQVFFNYAPLENQPEGDYRIELWANFVGLGKKPIGILTLKIKKL